MVIGRGHVLAKKWGGHGVAVHSTCLFCQPYIGLASSADPSQILPLSCRIFSRVVNSGSGLGMRLTLVWIIYSWWTHYNHFVCT